MPASMEEMERRELCSDVYRCRDLFNSGVFFEPSIFTESAFIEVLIKLNHILQSLNKCGQRVAWKDDVQIDLRTGDITDLVNYLRNAACHQNSPNNLIDGTTIKFVLNIVRGPCPGAVKLSDGMVLGCDYDDDACFFYGDKRIYLNRHIKKLIEELPGLIC